LKTLIDFTSGAHGHFLEYVINNYIYCIDEKFNIFTDSGASHNINYKTDYLTKSLLDSLHYTCWNRKIPTTQFDKVIHIKHSKKLDFVLLVNCFNRCQGELPSNDTKENIQKLHYDLMDSSDELGARGDWFHKLQHRDSGLLKSTDIEYSSELPVYIFNYSSFFDITEFFTELQNISVFLDDTFIPNQELTDLYYEFIKNNDGFTKYKNCKNILENSYKNNNFTFSADWQEQAYINFIMSKTFRMYDGELFSNNMYPTNTKDIYKIIQSHLDNFDILF